MQAYRNLEALFTRLYRFRHLVALASWDSQINLAEGGVEARGLAVAEAEDHIHTLITAPHVTEWIEAAIEAAGAFQDDGDSKNDMTSSPSSPPSLLRFTAMQRANLREMRRCVAAASCLPAEFLHYKSAVAVHAQSTWGRSREENRFDLFLPTLRSLVAIAREEGAYRAAAAAGRAATLASPLIPTPAVTPYEALIAQFEPGMTLAKLDALFDDIRSWLPGLLRAVMARQVAEDKVAGGAPPALRGPFPILNQLSLARHVIGEVWRFDPRVGRLDESAHPFTGNVREDCRISATFDEGKLLKGLLAVCHECGHHTAETNTGPRGDSDGGDHTEVGVVWATQPVAASRSLAVHESQALLAERVIGRSRAFADCLLPVLKLHFPNGGTGGGGGGGGVPIPTHGGPNYYYPHHNSNSNTNNQLTEIDMLTAEGLRRALQRVRPTANRVEADELSYTLHILLRYEIERDLVDGRMEAADVPRVWAAKCRSYLGIDITGRDDIGCLQDIHWAGGAFGYFPMYTVGAVLAAQLMAAIEKELGTACVRDCIRAGDIGPILAKQQEKIWDHGSFYETDELILRATGEPLSPRYFREHLERRYLRGED